MGPAGDRDHSDLPRSSSSCQQGTIDLRLNVFRSAYVSQSRRVRLTILRRSVGQCQFTKWNVKADERIRAPYPLEVNVGSDFRVLHACHQQENSTLFGGSMGPLSGFVSKHESFENPGGCREGGAWPRLTAPQAARSSGLPRAIPSSITGYDPTKPDTEGMTYE